MSVEDEIKQALEADGINADEAIQKSLDVSEEHTSISDREYSDFEREQMEKGWNPNGVKSADEYSRTEPLYEEIKARGKQIKQMQRTLESLTDHMSKQERIAYDKALDTLRREREEAIYRGDVNAVHQIEQEQQKLTTPAPQIPVPVLEFKEKYDNIFNSAGYEEMEIVNFINQRDSELMSRNLSPEQHMKTLEEHMVKKFPSYFNQGKEVVSRSVNSVETGTGSNVAKSSTRKSHNFQDLTQEQKQVARDFEKLGIMKIDEYIKQLVELKEI